MTNYTAKGIKEILEEHAKWLNNDDGMRADLRMDNLSGADLRGANLRRAFLDYAILSRADLRGANLSRADLRGANLIGANIRGANLSRADLRGAILPDRKIMDSVCPLHCPEEGSFIGWKKAEVALPSDESEMLKFVDVIVKLQIPEHAKRSSATSRKCRCDRVAVLDIQSLDGVSLLNGTIAHSRYDPSFTYEVGQKLYVDNFDEDRWNECSTGIHFFITKQEAIDY